jgi:hypothetical protein
MRLNKYFYFTFANDFAPLSPIRLPDKVNVNNFQFCVDIFPRILARRSALASVILQYRRERWAILFEIYFYKKIKFWFFYFKSSRSINTWKCSDANGLPSSERVLEEINNIIRFFVFSYFKFLINEQTSANPTIVCSLRPTKQKLIIELIIKK